MHDELTTIPGSLIALLDALADFSNGAGPIWLVYVGERFKGTVCHHPHAPSPPGLLHYYSCIYYVVVTGRKRIRILM